MRVDEFKRCLVKNDIQSAAYVAAKTPFLRDENALKLIEKTGNILLEYFSALMEHNPLNETEKAQYKKLLE